MHLLRFGIRLFLIILVMLVVTLWASYQITTHYQVPLQNKMEKQFESLSNALQISVQQLTAKGTTEDSLFADYANRLSQSGVREVTILNPYKELVASSRGGKSGRRGAQKRQDLVIAGTLGAQGPPPPKGRVEQELNIPIVVDNERRGYVRLHLVLDDIDALGHEANKGRLTATVVVFVLGLIGVAMISFGVSRNIDRLAVAADKVAAGDLSVRVLTKRRDEIGRLARTFNFMIDKLEENRALETRLRRAERSAAIGNLASAVAHEIRNPLNLISLSVDHLREAFRPGEPQRAQEFQGVADSVREELQRLNRLVGDFLSFGRPPRLAVRPTQVEEVVADVLSALQHQAAAARVELVTQSDPGLPEFEADPEALRTCFMNLALNAIQAMPDGGTLTAETKLLNDETRPQGLQVVFRDTGRGIAEANLERIFEPYFSTRNSGFGLGLAITQRLIEEHGGTISVASRLGEGTAFTIQLPLNRPEPAGVSA